MGRKAKPFNAFPFAYHEELLVEVTSLTNLGEGLARVQILDEEGKESTWVVFIPFALPEERVKIRIWKNEKQYSHADLLEVITPSSHRIEPRCALFGTCGGCQYQHFSYQKQLEWKQRHVTELLRHQADMIHPVNEAIASPMIWNYRSKITPHFKKPREGQISEIGFLKKGTRQSLIDVKQCDIAMDLINTQLSTTRERVRERAHQYKKGATLLLRAAQDQIYEDPRESIAERVGELEFRFLAGDFFQNNPSILPQFVEYASRQARMHSRFLIDAYCGSGLFGLSLAKHFEEVSMVEVSESGADWSRRNAEANGIKNTKILTASAEEIFQDISYPADETTVLIDPPRKGCSEEFLTQLFAYAPERVVYISCNPSTQARDLVFFKNASYHIIDVQPIDLFPHTRHLECIITLTRHQK